MIQRLYVNNYKCLVNFELHLQELSLLLGPCGVGKTAVLDIMYALRRLLSGDARVTDAHTFPTRTLTRWQRQDLQIFEIDVRLKSGDFTYRLEDACGTTLSQAVITSHHPELIDYLGCEHGVLLDKEISGVVTTRKPQVGADNDGLRLSELIARGWEE